MLRHSFRKSANTEHQNVPKYESKIEQAILNAKEPIHISEEDQEVINVLGQQGVWINKNETLNWNGAHSLNQYKINHDNNPEIIKKYYSQPIEYTQDIMVRYLKPPTPPPPGDIIIVHRNNNETASRNELPPIIIRQQEARAKTPEPIIIREAPPPMPQEDESVIKVCFYIIQKNQNQQQKK